MIYEVEHISFTYPQEKRPVLEDVSFSLREGEILSILGPNGAGKTTLLNCMAGLLKPQSGLIKIDGRPVRDLSPKAIAGQVSYVPQTHTPAFHYSVFEFVLMGRAPKVGMFAKPGTKDETVCTNALREMGIEHLKDRSYVEISGGERQQAMIARAMVQEPSAVLFDEPTAHLDYGNQHRVLRLIKGMAEKGYAVIITTHNPDHALLLDDKTAIIDQAGALTYGVSREIITEETLNRVYKSSLRLLDIQELGRVACVSPKL